MKILQICLRVPYPPADGGTIAMYNMAKGLHNAGADVKILAMNTKKHFIDPATLPKKFVIDFNPEMVYLNASIKLLPAIFNLFKKDSYNISRFDFDLFHNELERILSTNKYDIIQLESLFVTPYINTIRKFSDAKLVLRAHNMEHIIWERLAASENNFIKKSYLTFLAKRLKSYELSVLNSFDNLLVLTNEDLKLFQKHGCRKPMKVAPIGVDMKNYREFRSGISNKTVFHLGSMDWLPNIEGVDWFMEKVLPLVNKHEIKPNICLAGKGMPERIMELRDPQIDVTGRVNDAKRFMADKQIMIVPLLSGGGMRVKIIEGLALGKTIISTTIGAEGINYTHDHNIIIADTPSEFSDAIIKCISDTDFCKFIGEQAAKLADEEYNNAKIGVDVLNYYEAMIRKGPNYNTVHN